jgi:acyl-CoA hydrolase
MSWQDRYRWKVSTAAEAVRAIPPRTRILIGSGASEPSRLVEAMVRDGTHLSGNEIVHLLTLGPAPYVAPGLEERFRHVAFFIGANVRAAVQEGRADFMPVFLSEIPLLILSGRVKVDVAIIQVSPPDRHGFCSLGVSVDIVRAAVDTASLVLAEVNSCMPRTLGDSFIHADRLARMVAVDDPLHELAPEPLDEVCRQIGLHAASLIQDGACLQMGIGRIPDAVLSCLGDRNDLGIHTEMFSDGAMLLAQAGVITGRRKTLLPGKIVTSFVMGTKALYDWVDDNPAVEMRPSSFTNDPFQIARNDNMVAINSALAVDLTGQVAADTIGGRFFSGIGGQVDFIRGSARSKGGRPVIALPSTAKDGTISRIQPSLEAGAGVVTSRGDIHYVVTEHGIADLWGKNIRQRACALIEIAHPDFRPDLINAAKNRRYIFRSGNEPARERPGLPTPRPEAPAEIPAATPN